MVTIADLPPGVEILVEGYAEHYDGPDVAAVIRFAGPDAAREAFRRVASRPLQHPFLNRPCLSLGEPDFRPHGAGRWRAEVRFRG